MDAARKPNQLLKQVHGVLLDAMQCLRRESPAVYFPGVAAPRAAPPRRAQFRNEVMTHPFSELVFVFGGEADIVLAERAVSCGRGSFMIIPSQVSHCAGTCSMWERGGVEQCSADTLWMIAYPSGARLHFSYSRGEQISASPAVFVPDHQLIVLAELLVDETRGEGPEARQFVVKYLDLIYSRLAHGVCLESAMIELPNSYRPAEEIGLINASPLERAIKYIERNFDSRITLDDIARASYMSRAQLTRLFRRDRGQTVLEYVTHCRLEMAKSLLRYDSFSLHHIARLSGFGNVAYLSRQFSRHVGMPPSDYRQISDKTSI